MSKKVISVLFYVLASIVAVIYWSVNHGIAITDQGFVWGSTPTLIGLLLVIAVIVSSIIAGATLKNVKKAFSAFCRIIATYYVAITVLSWFNFIIENDPTFILLVSIAGIAIPMVVEKN